MEFKVGMCTRRGRGMMTGTIEKMEEMNAVGSDGEKYRCR
jgi:hypothetical protein